MTERTLREKVAHAMWLEQAKRAGTPSVIAGRTPIAFANTADQTRREWLGYADAALAAIDAHTAEQPAPDAVAEALEAAAAIADEYASENFRMATDSVLLDRMQDFSQTDERQVEGNGHSAAGIASRNIAAAIRALAKGPRL